MVKTKVPAITVAGTESATVIDGRIGTMNQDAVTFHTGEGPDSVLKNFVISVYGNQPFDPRICSGGRTYLHERGNGERKRIC